MKSYSQDPAFTQSFMVPESINPSFSGFYEIELSWRFYGLGGLVTTPILFGYMLGNLGVSPTSGEVVS